MTSWNDFLPDEAVSAMEQGIVDTPVPWHVSPMVPRGENEPQAQNASANGDGEGLEKLVSLCNRAWATTTAASEELARLDQKHRTVARATAALHEDTTEEAHRSTSLRRTAENVSRALTLFDAVYVLSELLGLPVLTADAVPREDWEQAVGSDVVWRRLQERGDPLTLDPLELGDPAFPAVLSRLDDVLVALTARAGVGFIPSGPRHADAATSSVPPPRPWKDARFHAEQARLLRTRALALLRSSMMAHLETVSESLSEESPEDAADTVEWRERLGLVQYRMDVLRRVAQRADAADAEMALRAAQRHADSPSHGQSQPQQQPSLTLRASSRAPMSTLALGTATTEQMLATPRAMSPARVAWDVQSLYWDVRWSLMLPTLVTRWEEIADCNESPLTRVRQVVAGAQATWSTERRMFEDIAGAGEAPALQQATATLLQEAGAKPIAEAVERILTRVVACVQTLEGLCDLVLTLREEVVDGILGASGGENSALAECVESLVGEAEERITILIYRQSIDQLESWEPGPDDLRYPASLITLEQMGKASLTGAWYRPVQEALECISLVYRVLDRDIFAGITADMISACLTAVARGATLLASQSPELVEIGRGVTDRVTLPRALDADLFLVRHLLVLREQLAPFEVDLASTPLSRKHLDFTSTSEALSALLRRASELFSWSTGNPLLAFVVDGIPTVHSETVDPKKDLEQNLRRACEQCIRRVTALLVHPIAARPESSPEAVEHALRSLRSLWQHRLPAVRHRMRLYLPSPATHSILFKPVKAHVVEALASWRVHLQEAEQLEAASMVDDAMRELIGVLDASDEFMYPDGEADDSGGAAEQRP